jgi:hypothetical protein
MWNTNKKVSFRKLDISIIKLIVSVVEGLMYNWFLEKNINSQSTPINKHVLCITTDLNFVILHIST